MKTSAQTPVLWLWLWLIAPLAGCDQNQLVEFDLATPADASTGLDFAPAMPDLAQPDLAMVRCAAAEFDGVHAVITAPGRAGMNPPSAVTVEAWVYATRIGPVEQVVAGHWGNADYGTASYVLLLDATGHPSFVISKGGTDVDLVSTSQIPVTLDRWTHVAGVFDPLTQGVYAFTGGTGFARTAAPAVAAPFAVDRLPLHIGRYSSVNSIERPFAGFIDEVRFSSTARYTGTFTPAPLFAPDGSTIALYHLDEGSGDAAADASTHGNVALLEQNARFAMPPECRPLDGGVADLAGTGDAMVDGGVPWPPLGSAASFGVLGAQAVKSGGMTSVTGNVGVAPGATVTGFPPGRTVNGAVHTNDATAIQAHADALFAYDQLLASVCDVDLTGRDLGGLTLAPGIYCFTGPARLTGVLTLDARGNPNAVFAFQMAETLVVAPGASVALAKSASACHVFFQVGASATLATGSDLAGTVLAASDITLEANASLRGRALSQNGSVTLDTNTLDAAGCPGM